MAQITWMNVPIPDIGSTQQQGIRTAADLFGNAAKSAQSGVAGLQAIQDAEKAAQTQAADRFVLENMLSTQDPNKYNQMRADGSLLGPAAGKASNSTLLAAEARSGQLYTQDRERTRNAELQAAERIWDLASPVAVNDPAKAQEMLAAAKFSNAEDAAAFSHRARQLFVDPENGRASRERAKKEEMDRKAADLTDRVIAQGANPDGANRVLMGEQDPLIRQEALSLLSKRGENIQQYYSSAPTPTESSVTGIIDGVENAQYRQFGNNMRIGLNAVRAAGVNAPFPGSPDWGTQNGGRAPTAADVMTWTDTYVKPGSEAERGKGKGTTAIGPYQIVNSTRRDFIQRYGKQLFGTTDPARIPFTLENEDKLASKIYEEQLVKNKSPEAWTSTQNYPSFKDLKAFEGKSWEDAKPLLTYIDGGVAPASYSPRVKQFTDEIESRERGLSEGAKAIRNAKPNEAWGLNQASEELVKSFGKETRPGEARELVESTVRKAKEAGTVITHAEAVELIKNSVTDDTWASASNLSKDLDLEDSKLVQSAKDLGNARADLKSHEKNLETLKRVQELTTQYKADQLAAEKQLTAAKRGTDAGEAALAAFKKWQNTSDRLARIVAPKGKTGVTSNLAQEATPAMAQAAPPAERSPDIDLMLPSKQKATPSSEFGTKQFNTR